MMLSHDNPLSADEEPLLNGGKAPNSYPMNNLGARASHEEPDYLPVFLEPHTAQRARSSSGQVRFAFPRARNFWAVIKWLRGPQPPRVYKITPVCAEIQTASTKLFIHRRFGRSMGICLFIFICFFWLLALVSILAHSLGCTYPGNESLTRLSCTSRFWCGPSFHLNFQS